MLGPDEERYLKTVPEDVVVRISPFDPEARKTGDMLVEEIKEKLPNISIYYIGSTVLEISGENDIDINLVSGGNFDEELSALEKLYGDPNSLNRDVRWVEWKFEKNGYPVELYLNGEVSPILAKQIETHRRIANSPELLRKYDEMKKDSDGVSLKEYIRRKFEFYSNILTD